MCYALQIGDCRGFVGLVELLWHQLEIKLGVYNVQVSQYPCTYQINCSISQIAMPNPQAGAICQLSACSMLIGQFKTLCAQLYAYIISDAKHTKEVVQTIFAFYRMALEQPTQLSSFMLRSCWHCMKGTSHTRYASSTFAYNHAQSVCSATS